MSNLFLFLLFVAIQLWQFIAVPLLPPVAAWTLIPLVFLNNSLWSLIHEAVHGNLFSNKIANKWGGQILSMLFGSSFRFLSSGHLTHHAVNRTEDERLEIVGAGQSIWLARIQYYFFMVGGVYFIEVVSPLLFALPKSLLRYFRPLQGMPAKVYNKAIKRKWEVTFEAFAAWTFLLGSAVLYGERWPLFAGILLARGFLISSLEYIYHYGNPIDDVGAAYNLQLPHWASKLILHFNMHHSHHRNPNIPWNELPVEVERTGELFNDGYFKAALRAWKGPIQIVSGSKKP